MSPNGWTQLLRVWGIPFSAYLLIAFFKGAGNFFREEDNSFFKRIGLFVIVMIAVFPQTLSVSYFISFYISIHYKTNEQKYENWSFMFL